MGREKQTAAVGEKLSLPPAANDVWMILLRGPMFLGNRYPVAWRVGDLSSCDSRGCRAHRRCHKCGGEGADKRRNHVLLADRNSSKPVAEHRRSDPCSKPGYDPFRDEPISSAQKAVPGSIMDNGC